MFEERKNIFESKIKPLLTYIGTIGAVIMTIAYIILVCVLIFGFKADKTFTQSLIFAGVNAVMGIIIMQFLKIQGISFAKELDENKAILQEYYNTNTKDKKPHSLSYFWLTSCLKDVLGKALGIIISTAGMIYIVIEGTKDYTLFFVALVNLLMFVCFGILSLTKAYDFFNEQHIPYIINKLKEIKEETHDNTSEWNGIEESAGTGSEE